MGLFSRLRDSIVERKADREQKSCDKKTALMLSALQKASVEGTPLANLYSIRDNEDQICFDYTVDNFKVEGRMFCEYDNSGGQLLILNARIPISPDSEWTMEQGLRSLENNEEYSVGFIKNEENEGEKHFAVMEIFPFGVIEQFKGDAYDETVKDFFLDFIGFSSAVIRKRKDDIDSRLPR